MLLFGASDRALKQAFALDAWQTAMLDDLPLVDRDGVLGLDPERFVQRRLLGQGSEDSTVLLHDAFSSGHDPAMPEVLLRGGLSVIVRRLFGCPGRRRCIAASFRDALRMVAFSIDHLFLRSTNRSLMMAIDPPPACAPRSLDGSYPPTSRFVVGMDMR